MSTRGWRDGCSSGGPRFNSQHPHGSSQLTISLIPGDTMPSSGLLRVPGMQIVCQNTCRWNTYPHKHKRVVKQRKDVCQPEQSQSKGRREKWASWASTVLQRTCEGLGKGFQRFQLFWSTVPWKYSMENSRNKQFIISKLHIVLHNEHVETSPLSNTHTLLGSVDATWGVDHPFAWHLDC